VVIDTERAPGRTLERLVVAPGLSTLGPRFVELRDPTPLPAPELVAFNPEVAALLELDPAEGARPEFTLLAAGNARFSHVPSFAAIYAGHQFGTFVSQLGDGRAITLGEVVTSSDARWEWQLKGAGVTAFSRFGDGRAVLRSTIREYLASEALHHLGIPTTRALSIARSDEPVFRERPESAAVLSRVAPSHLRFGSFELFHYRGDFASVKTLAGYAIAHFFHEFADLAEPERYARWLAEIVTRTARLAAQWEAVGFAHGVLNTDNMSLLGLTLDYGPYGFLDAYEPGFICNHSDDTGRYAFDRQAGIALWNCKALAAALDSLLPKDDAAPALATFEPTFRATYIALMRAKLGLAEERPEDPLLVADLLALLAAERSDYTNTFRGLSALPAAAGAGDVPPAEAFADRPRWEAWRDRYRLRLAAEGSVDAARQAAMNAVNPKFVLRNYLAQQAIAAAEERDYSELERLHAVLRAPFDEQPGNERYAAAPPDWAAEISVSCSS
jgi:serine/tyrosine/threonine adenylyltransferase